MVLLGIKTVAIDMPNYKESKLVQIPRNKPKFLEFVINQFETLRERRIILVAPSMSGGYALPYVIHGKIFHQNLISLLRLRFKIETSENVSCNSVPYSL